MSLIDEIKTMGNSRSLKEKRQMWLQDKIQGFIIEITSAIKEAAKNNQKYVMVRPGRDLEPDTYCISYYGNCKDYLEYFEGPQRTKYTIEDIYSKKYETDRRYYNRYAVLYIPAEDMCEIVETLTTHFKNEGFENCNIRFEDVVWTRGSIIKRKVKAGYKILVAEIFW